MPSPSNRKNADSSHDHAARTRENDGDDASHSREQFKIREIRAFQPAILEIPWYWPSPDFRQKRFIYADEAVLERIMAHAAEQPGRECFGLLLGNAYRDEARGILWMHLQDSVAARSVSATAATVEVSTDEFQRLNDEVDRIREHTDDNVRKIGWYHSHPDIGVFMSKTDRNNQERFYPQEWQIALVVDPVRDEMGFFQGAQSQACRFAIVNKKREEAVFEEITEPRYEIPSDRPAAPLYPRKPRRSSRGRSKGLWSHLRGILSGFAYELIDLVSGNFMLFFILTVALVVMFAKFFCG